MGGDVQASLLGLASAAIWGTGDFCGGLASRRAAAPLVLTLSASTGLTLLLILAFAFGEPLPPLVNMGWGALGGLFGTLGLASLYRGLSVGRAALVAPTSAVVAAALPALFSAFSQGLPGPLRVFGFALALLGIWLVAQTDEENGKSAGLGLALLAGVGFGVFFIMIDRASEQSKFWPLVAARSVTVLLTLSTLFIRRPQILLDAQLAGLSGLAGMLDAGGNLFFVLANQVGRLDVAAVLSSLYPAATVILSAIVLRERVTRLQIVGLLAILLAIVLIMAQISV